MKTRLCLAASLAALCLAQARAARAEGPPAYSALPVGRLTSPPTRRPARVAAGEKVPGIFILNRNYPARMPLAQRYISLTADRELAEAFKRDEGSRPPGALASACLTEARDFFGRTPVPSPDLDLRDWSEHMAPEAVAFPKTANNPSSGVVALHSERVVEGNGAATLEAVDAWFDPATRGTKLIAKTSLPLKLMRPPAFGLKVYAGRDERPDGRRFVQFVVVQQAKPFARSALSPMFSIHQDGQMAHAQHCAHLRVGLPVEQDAGESASIIAPVILPPEGPKEKPKAEGGARTAPEPPPPPSHRAGRARPPLPTSMAMAMAMASGDFEEREVRTRAMAVQVSLSQTTRDKEPLVSVSLGWEGRERAQIVMAPPDD